MLALNVWKCIALVILEVTSSSGKSWWIVPLQIYIRLCQEGHSLRCTLNSNQTICWAWSTVNITPQFLSKLINTLSPFYNSNDPQCMVLKCVEASKDQPYCRWSRRGNFACARFHETLSFTSPSNSENKPYYSSKASQMKFSSSKLHETLASMACCKVQKCTTFWVVTSSIPVIHWDKYLCKWQTLNM